LLSTAATAMGSLTARFLREEIERADIAPDNVAATSDVRMGSEVKFSDHGEGRIHRAKLVFPEEARDSRCISLIGLGPGQSIR
jgi:transcription elongation GreA/GreB family factor